MNIEGLDYNTQREQLVMPEYGREIQDMVKYAMTIGDKEERQRCAEAIVAIMGRMSPDDKSAEGYDRKLWDHLALLSGFQLEVDYPYDVSQAAKIAQRPEPMEYPMKKIPVRHYGSMLFGMFEKLKAMEPGKERDALAQLVASQMHRCLLQWGHGSCAEEKVADDLARYTDGKVQLDVDAFRLVKITESSAKTKKRR